MNALQSGTIVLDLSAFISPRDTNLRPVIHIYGGVTGNGRGLEHESGGRGNDIVLQAWTCVQSESEARCHIYLSQRPVNASYCKYCEQVSAVTDEPARRAASHPSYCASFSGTHPTLVRGSVLFYTNGVRNNL